MSMDKLQVERIRDRLQAFDFKRLFIEELGWSHARGGKPITINIADATWQAAPIAELSGVVAFLIPGLPDQPTRLAIHKALSQHAHENLVIFVDRAIDATMSLWLWVKREDSKRFPREHLYVRGQPGDLFISKLSGIVIDINELDEQGHFPLAQLVERMRSALDVERVTKKFFKEYDAQRLDFVELIHGIPAERDRRWYASVVMNRLMFVWFLQRKHFLDGGNPSYLTDRLTDSQRNAKDAFYRGFLQALFFEGFAKPPDQRSSDAKRLIGDIPYLNGGLFIPHRLERDYGPAIHIPDLAFENLFGLFGAYSWNLNDSPGGLDNEINPDVLGYIFEKYINQKAFGAYYTRPEITEYLCERSIHRLILDRVNTENPFDLPLAAGRKFHGLPDLLLNLDASLCRELLFEVLPQIKLLDPACGSGAFLVAAMKTLINIYSAVIGRIKFLNDRGLAEQLKRWETEHKSLGYFIKRSIITDNLFGVDIMEEATEIARLRLFLALVASAQNCEQLEPLPNIDFNILCGNSLIGLMRVDAGEFDGHQGIQRDLFRKDYRQVVEEKNRLIDNYRHTAAWAGGIDLCTLKASIEQCKQEAQTTLNDLLLDQWDRAGIRFEQATWDSARGKPGKPHKRKLKMEDIEALQPFHWGFEFDEILHQRGGFDAIITNPPWDIFKPNAKEFFQEHSDLVTKNKMTIKEFEKAQGRLLQNAEIRSAWLEYLSRFPHVNLWFRKAGQYAHQVAEADGKRIVTDLNLYKLFLEQCAHLLRTGGACGIVIPSGIYTDLGSKGLREMLFNETSVTGLFGFENRRDIFEGVDSRFKFVVLTFQKGGNTASFPAAFMRLDVGELAAFPSEGSISVPVEAIKRLSPDAYAVQEYRSASDIAIVEKLVAHPLLGETAGSSWRLMLRREFHMTDDAALYHADYRVGRLPLLEGKMLHQFNAAFAQPRYWLDESAAREELLNSRIKQTLRRVENAGVAEKPDRSRIRLDYESYRLAFRDVARNTDQRTFIGAILPPGCFCPHTVSLECVYWDEVRNGRIAYNVSGLDTLSRLYLLGVLNSFTADYLLRLCVTAHLSFFFLYSLPVPRVAAADPRFALIASRVAFLVCITPEFDTLAQEVGFKSHQEGASAAEDRARLRAELDGLIAHLYGLTEAEFAHVLSAFPLVAEPVKIAALNAWRDVERGLIR